VNLSIHLPNDVLGRLDAHVKASANSRSAVVREAVTRYLDAQQASHWPPSLLAHMAAGAVASRKTAPEQAPDFDAIRAEMNAAMSTRV
jgi:Arc/MetJ-type ribon-helix-helix transcriptional regulator